MMLKKPAYGGKLKINNFNNLNKTSTTIQWDGKLTSGICFVQTEEWEELKLNQVMRILDSTSRKTFNQRQYY